MENGITGAYRLLGSNVLMKMRKKFKAYPIYATRSFFQTPLRMNIEDEDKVRYVFGKATKLESHFTKRKIVKLSNVASS